MHYEWDEKKNNDNIAKHGFDFLDAPLVFDWVMLARLDDRVDYGEDRWIGLGVLHGSVVAIVYTEPDEETRRIISLRKALKHEQAEYKTYLKDRLGTDQSDDR